VNEMSKIMGRVLLGRKFGIARTLLAAVLLWSSTGVTEAQELPIPRDPVVLTVSGGIEHTNRGALDALERRESLFKYHEVAFERAAQFDLGALERLGMHEVTVSHPDWPKAFAFEGPLLRDVLTAVGATGRVARILALDGYAAEIPISEIQDRPFIVAVKREGRYLGIGDQGPTWIIVPPGSDRKPGHEQGSEWVWAAFYIAVE
jgi:hypothetical protein